MYPDMHVDVRMLGTSTAVDMSDLQLSCCIWLHACCYLPVGSSQHLISQDYLTFCGFTLLINIRRTLHIL